MMLAADEAGGAQDKNQPPSIRFSEDDDEIILPQFAVLFDLWIMKERFGILPEGGGYLDQPLDVMNQLHAIGMAIRTRQTLEKKDANFEKEITADQREYLAWLKRQNG